MTSVEGLFVTVTIATCVLKIATHTLRCIRYGNTQPLQELIEQIDIITRRLVATVIDFTIVIACLLLIDFVFYRFIYAYGAFRNLALNVFVISWLVYGLYCMYFEQSQNQASFGKRIMCLTVTNRSGKKPSKMATILRVILCCIAPIVLRRNSEALFCWTIFMAHIFFTEDYEAFYDTWSETKVVRAKRSRKIDWRFFQVDKFKIHKT